MPTSYEKEIVIVFEQCRDALLDIATSQRSIATSQRSIAASLKMIAESELDTDVDSFAITIDPPVKQ